MPSRRGPRPDQIDSSKISDILVGTGDEVVIDLDGSDIQILSISDASITFSVVNQAFNISKSVTLIVTSTATGGTTLNFNSSWKWVGSKPTTLESGEQAIFSILSIGDLDSEIIVAYEVVGDGS